MPSEAYIVIDGFSLQEVRILVSLGRQDLRISLLASGVKERFFPLAKHQTPPFPS
jgi:hypothetical protein